MGLEFVLRPATAEHSSQIRDLIREARINPMGLDWHRFVVAVNYAGGLLGCGQLKPHGDKVVELASIAVKPQYRGHGIARAIIEDLISRGPRPLYLTCRAGLGVFYQKWGFTVLNGRDMPPYFRRISRIASLLTSLARHDEGLLVMVLK